MKYKRGFNHPNNWPWKEIIFHANIYLGAAKEPFESEKKLQTTVFDHMLFKEESTSEQNSFENW